MTDPAARRWSVEEFFAWQERRDERYELVGGFPVRMMAGAENVHDDIVVNILVSLGTQLRGGGCRPFTGHGSIETLPGQIRRPDVGVDCGRRDPNGLKAADPRVVVEVLSPGTRDFDTIDKLGEYKSVSSVTSIVFVEPNAPEVALWSRTVDHAWERHAIFGLDATLDLVEIGARLELRDIYDGIEFPTGPRLIHWDPGAAPP